MTRNKAWERALFGHVCGKPYSLSSLQRMTGKQIAKYSQIIETARRMATTANTSKERAVQLSIVTDAEAHLRGLEPFMTDEQKKRVAQFLNEAVSRKDSRS